MITFSHFFCIFAFFAFLGENFTRALFAFYFIHIFPLQLAPPTFTLPSGKARGGELKFQPLAPEAKGQQTYQPADGSDGIPRMSAPHHSDTLGLVCRSRTPPPKKAEQGARLSGPIITATQETLEHSFREVFPG